MTSIVDLLRQLDAWHYAEQWPQPYYRTILTDAANRIEELERALYQHGHIVDIGSERFGLEHPVECRKAGLLNCSVEKALEALEGPPRLVGRYSVMLKDDGSLSFGDNTP